MAKTQEENQAMANQLEDRHVKELEENRQRLDQTLPMVPKASAELLNLKKIQEQLAR